MYWIVLTLAVMVVGLLLCCIYVLFSKISSLKERIRELNEKVGIPNHFSEYNRIFLNDVPVGNGHQIRFRSDLYEKTSRLVSILAPGLSVSTYVSNVVEEHLDCHREMLKNEFDRIVHEVLLWKN